MRKGMLVVGIVLLVVGIVLWYYPMNLSSSQSVPAGDGYIASANPPLALLTPNIPYSLSWSSSSSVNVTVYNCGSDSGCANYHAYPVVTSGKGSSGSVSWSGAKGTFYLVLPSGSTSASSVTLNTGEPLLGGLLGLLLFVVGLILLIVGAVTKPKGRAPPQPYEAAPAEETAPSEGNPPAQ